MRAYKRLPQGYRLKLRIDLVRDRKLLRTISLFSLILAAVTLAIGFFIQPERPPLQLTVLFAQAVAGLACIALYIIGHEAVHGALMWFISRERPAFGFKLMYAYAGSKAYFGKSAYLIIAVAPLILWAVVLNALIIALPPVCFWPVWVVQVMNLSGSAGDLYMFSRIVAEPSDILVQDDGTAMTVWRPV